MPKRCVLKALPLIAVAATVLGLATPAWAAPAPQAPRNPGKFLALSIDSVAPGTVTLTSDPWLTVTATVTNVGDRPVSSITARVQRAAPVGNSAGLRGALRLDQEQFTVAGPFEPQADRLSPGERKQFTLTIPLRSAAAPDEAKPTKSLRIDRTGVYPLLINVNGKPAYGKQAHLDDARFLLPVLGVPPDPNAPDPHSESAQAVPPPAAQRVATTILWPLADRPRRAPGQPGSLTDSVELTDDELAAELGKDGRLDGLLGALESATSANTDRDHKLADSVCLAVDPDLLETVVAMTRGYRVPVTAGKVDGPTKDGSGQTAATLWLGRLRTLAAGMCTVAMPYAQADLRTIAAVDDDPLSGHAVAAPADIVDTVLSTKSVRGLAVPSTGAIDDRTGAMLHKFDVSTVVVGDTAVRDDAVGDAPTTASPTPPEVVSLTIAAPAPAGISPVTARTETMRAATFDVTASSALGAVGERPSALPVTPAALRYDLGADSRQARLQDALGALSWRAVSPQAAPRSELLAPPPVWTPNAEEAGSLLTQLATLYRSGLAVPRRLTSLLAEPPAPSPFRAAPPASAPGKSGAGRQVDAEVPPVVADDIRRAAAPVDAMAGALVDTAQELTPDRFLSPLREDLLRAASLSRWQGADRVTAEAWARGLVATTAAADDALTRRETVLTPSGVYTLASAQSPLLLVARNGLPVAIRVLIDTDAPADMKITDVGEVQLPANGTRSLQLPTQVNATRDLTVTFSLSTPSGRELGAPTSVRVRSNAYGKSLTLITECAGALLVLLAGRRLWRRFRGRPDPADTGLDTGTRRRLNRYVRAKRRVRDAEEEQAELEQAMQKVGSATTRDREEDAPREDKEGEQR
ncbi:MAG: hypothetical protein HOQ24_03760 [Mycobacteriaceae bacterium]|nr:hypothetical protein [Mycobacteriaceae bacterium]